MLQQLTASIYHKPHSINDIFLVPYMECAVQEFYLNHISNLLGFVNVHRKKSEVK